MSDEPLWTPPPDPEREARLKAIIAAVFVRNGWGPFFLDTDPPTSAYVMADGSLEVR